MSETPESARNNGAAAEPAGENAPTTAGTAPATAPAQTAAAEPAAAESAAAEPRDTDPEVVDPPSSPVSARGHVNRPDAPAADAQEAPATEVPATPAPSAPAKVTEPEPVVATDDDIAAAVARSHTGDVPAAAAAGTATVDTASPAQSATPVIVAAEAATAAQPTTVQPTAQPVAGEATWAPEPGAAPAPGYAQPVTPIYVQRPEPPKKKSNRGFGILIALVGTVVFAVLWVIAVVLVGYALTPTDQFAESLSRFFLSQSAGWVPVVAFFVGMVVLIQIINRARWWAYILGGLFVALFVYFAYVGASLVDLHVWTLTANEAVVVVQRLWVAPFAVLAGVIAREISMWTGAWLAARGRKLKIRNAEAQAAYDQQLADAQNQAVAAYATPQGY
ncbi:hypothetical protein [Leifsonia sp. Le1]|uniref:hypothetical protein n=1 Tax=Leifsonia sp. Le1 TaxID=3404918 RepID=UPI003EBA2C2C